MTNSLREFCVPTVRPSRQGGSTRLQHNPPTLPAHRPHKPRARVCGRCALRSRPGPPCCLHVRARAAPLPCSRPHPLNKTRGRGRDHYSSAMRVNRQQGRPIRKRTGEPGTAPGPGKTRPRFHVPQTPPSSPRKQRQTLRGAEGPVRSRIIRALGVAGVVAVILLVLAALGGFTHPLTA